MKTITYDGILSLHEAGEASDILYLSSVYEPFASKIDSDRLLNGPYATVRYYISDRQMTKGELEENLIRVVSGDVHADYGSHYSDYTGYLWTDEDVVVGGHDLIKELKDNIGKWLFMEIDWSKETKK